MSNKLEGFVRDNKREFEVKGPSDALWSKIEAELDKKQPKRKAFKMYQWMSIAAMLVLYGRDLFWLPIPKKKRRNFSGRY
ncbi:hypothetical protein [Pedobacter sp. SL55]|uniref:hypothetical protein n=1 Tax=Pedobacter sp. SL55 TaxID=2995161 RepID=UPI00226F0B30|nr:hypothetical protein [Pedobacter sp. SL55]WAC41759.1 hypothetical protein OVA16_05195 [Pedobacter sp. SL55]